MNPSIIRRRDIMKVRASTDCSSSDVGIYQRRCYCAVNSAATIADDVTWMAMLLGLNPTALLMNDVAVAGLTESVPMLLSATAKLYLCVRPSAIDE